MFERKSKHTIKFSNSSKKSYIQFEYPESHWARHIPGPGDSNFIATLEIFDIRMTLKLMSKDARGYRAIVGLVGDDMESTFNREYKDSEKLALSIALCILSSVYEGYGIVAQTQIAGNDSQSLTNGGNLLLGNEKEPSLLHGHIIGRGNPDKCYIANVPLRGPVAGELFNMRANGGDEGNSSKIIWREEEMNSVADILAHDLLIRISNSSEYKNVASIITLRPSVDVSITHRVSNKAI